MKKCYELIFSDAFDELSTHQGKVGRHVPSDNLRKHVNVSKMVFYLNFICLENSFESYSALEEGPVREKFSIMKVDMSSSWRNLPCQGVVIFI